MVSQAVILGGGSWGMAVARLLDKNGFDITLCEFLPEEFCKLVEHRTNPDKLPGLQLPPSIKLTDTFNPDKFSEFLLILAIPAQYLRNVLKKLRSKIDRASIIVNLAKGIEKNTLKRMSEVIREETGVEQASIVTLSGPSHAEEVIIDLPTTVVAAGSYEENVVTVQESFSNQHFRVYKSRDIVGVELGGSLKNIIAIAVGICDGLNMGDNTKGALMTRGLAEITRLGLALGAEAETFAGLSGLGDLVTTCISRHSRNRHVGEKIGQGEKLEDILKRMTMVAEGVDTTRSGFELARNMEVEMPITEAVHDVLFNDMAPSEAVRRLMERELKSEIWQ